MGQTFAQKILGRAAGKAVEPGETVSVEPDLVLSRDDSSLLVERFRRSAPGGRVKHPGRVAMVLDQASPAATGEQAAGHALVRDFVAEQGIEHFYDIGSGVCHQVIPEKHLALPGGIVVGTGGHTRIYGAFNTFATDVEPDEVPSIWETGKTAIRVPETIEINLDGNFVDKVSAKDLILTIAGKLGPEGAGGRAVEFHGTSLGSLLVHERMTIAGMGAETSAMIAVFPADRITEKFLFSHEMCSRAMWSDADAEFCEAHDISLDEIVPMVARPHEARNVCPVSDLPETKVSQVFLGTCTNGRIEDLAAALKIMKGRRVVPSVRMIVGAASRDEFVKALQQGVIEEFVKAGAVVVPPGCGPCMGAHMGALAPGEVCLSTGGVNTRGRMGDSGSYVYLASPETAAATAVTGVITDPREV